MADFGNHFTSNSGKYRHNTIGHQESDSEWTIVNRPNDTKITYEGFVSENNKCSIVPDTISPDKDISYTQTRNGANYIAHYTLENNENVKGDISEDGNNKPNWYTIMDSNRNVLTEHMVSTDANITTPNTNIETGIGNTWKNTLSHNIPLNFTYNFKWIASTKPRGYRQSKIKYVPYIEYDKASHNDGTTSDHSTVVTTTQYDARQTFLNHPDPYARLHVSIENHDNPNSTSPIFAKIRTSKNTTYTSYYMDYKHDFSYAYTFSEKGASLTTNKELDGTWSDKFTIDITYNRLPTYPKELVLTYDTNKYNDISYDGGTLDIEAKALLNGTYQGFTTSSSTDAGFTTYTRYAYITYKYATYNTSGTYAGHSENKTYTFKICQMPSKLLLSYEWSINQDWAHLSNKSGNKTTVTIDDINDVKPSVGGTLSIKDLPTSINNGGTGSGTISGVTWTGPQNKAARSCIVTQTMNLKNCIAQNITPKNSSGMPVKSMKITQNGMTWNNPSFDMKWKVSQKNKITTTYNDSYDHGWPTISIGGISTSDGSEKTTSWIYGTSSKSVSVSMPNISRHWVRTYTNGTVSISKLSDTPISYKGGAVTINLDPNITFRHGFTSGVSERNWTISNTANNATNQEYWTLNKFNDFNIKLPAIAATNHVFGDATLSWRDTGIQDLTFSKSSKTWNNSNSDDSFTTTLDSNLPTIGEWYCSTDGNTLVFTSTTRNSKPTSGTISFYGSTYQDGVLTPNPSTITISQDGTNISGTITIKAEGIGINTYTHSVPYPIDGNVTTASFTLNDPIQRYVYAAGTLAADIYDPSGNISVSGQPIYVSSSGYPYIDSVDDTTQKWFISAESDIVQSNPSNFDGLGGSIDPLAPSYHYEYKLNDGSWEESTSFIIESNKGTVTEDSSATLTATTYTDVKDGIYRYERGHYKRNSTSEVTHNVYIRVVDNNDGTKIYEGRPDSKTQYGDDGADYYTGGSWLITPDNDYNCTVSTKEINYTGSEYVSSEEGIGAFNVTPDWYNNHDSYPTSNNSDEWGINFVSNLSNTISRNSSDDATPSSSLYGNDKTFQPNETISQEYGVKSSSPDIITKTTSTSGSITWKYKYKYSVTNQEDPVDPWHYTEHEAYGRYDPPADIVNTKYYRCVNNNGNGWVRLSESAITFTATSIGTYTVEIAWMKTDSNGNYINDDRKGYSKHKITIGQITRIYRLLVSISGNSNKDAFDTTDWTLTATVTAQYKDASSDWTNTTTPSGISYSWNGATGSGSTATVAVSSVSMGSDGNSLGTKNVSVTVSLSGYTSGSKTVTVGRYGKSYYNA